MRHNPDHLWDVARKVAEAVVSEHFPRLHGAKRASKVGAIAFAIQTAVFEYLEGHPQYPADIPAGVN